MHFLSPEEPPIDIKEASMSRDAFKIQNGSPPEGVGGMIHVKFKTNVVLHGGSAEKLPVEGEALVRRLPN